MKMKIILNKLSLQVFVALVSIFLFDHCALANELDLNPKLSYDIYFGSGQSQNSVIKDVRIMELKDIGGKTFLIIKSRGFKIKQAQGYVAFDSITAIIPSNEYGLINELKVDTR